MKLKLFMLAIISFTVLADASAQKNNKKITITGKVTDYYDNPVSGALIMIDGKTTSYKTNIKGLYKIKIKPDVTQIGVFTTITGETQEAVNGRKVINFRLGKFIPETASDQADKGKTGVTERKNKQGQDVSGKEYTSFSDIYEMLGTVPGVSVSGTSVSVRGTQTWGSSSPLFVLNGTVVGSISSIDPSMVKSIQVLKGPSASIYGMQGANGVIVIQLK